MEIRGPVFFYPQAAAEGGGANKKNLLPLFLYLQAITARKPAAEN